MLDTIHGGTCSKEPAFFKQISTRYC